jgi:hypothetical protein
VALPELFGARRIRRTWNGLPVYFSANLKATKNPANGGVFVEGNAESRSAETTGWGRGEQNEFAPAILAPSRLVVTELSGLVFAKAAGDDAISTNAEANQ